jgi:hypothetical protein
MQSKARQSLAALEALERQYTSNVIEGTFEEMPTVDGVKPPQSLGGDPRVPQLPAGEEQTSDEETEENNSDQAKKKFFRVKTPGDYRKLLEELAYRLFTGEIGVNIFTSELKQIIDDNMTVAWANGAGINIDLIPDADLKIILAQALDEKLYVDKLATFLQNNASVAESYEQLFQHLDPWVNSWHRVENIAKAKTHPETNYMWQADPGKENCRHCAALNGTVATGDAWYASGVYPRSRTLECGGFYCGCDYIETDSSPTTDLPTLP